MSPDTIPAGNAVIYARVSSQEQERGSSLEGQVQRALKYAADHRLRIIRPPWQVVESAKDAGREAFNDMLTFLKKNQSVKHVIVEKVDRLSRNYDDLATVVRLAKQDGVYFHFQGDAFVFHGGSTASEFGRLGMGGLFATMFTWDQTEKIKRGMTLLVDKGRWLHKAPWGFIQNKNTGMFEPHPEEGRFRAMVYELAATGKYSLSAICAELQRRGCPKKAYPSFIERIIRNPFATGYFIWKGKLHKAICIVPLITWELFQAGIRGLERHGKPKGRHRDFAYSGGLLKCGVCGRAIVYEIKKEKYVYARCAGASRCGNEPMRQEDLDPQMLEMVKSISIDGEVAGWLAARIQERLSENGKSSKDTIADLRRQISRLDTWLEKAYEDRVADILSEDMWKTKSNKWIEEKARLQGLLEQEQCKDEESSKDVAARLLELSKNLAKAYESATPHERREILHFVSSNLTVTHKKLSWSYQKPFELLAQVGKTQEWGTLVDDVRTTVAAINNDSFKAALEKIEIALLPHWPTTSCNVAIPAGVSGVNATVAAEL